MKPTVALDLLQRWRLSDVPDYDEFRLEHAAPKFVLELFDRNTKLPMNTRVLAAAAFRGQSVVATFRGAASVAEAIGNHDAIAAVQTAIMIHAVAHALSQPMLDANQGPLVVLLTSTPDASAAAFQSMRGACEAAGLIIHDTASGMKPAMPANRRPDIALGTPRSVMEQFANNFFTGDRVSLVATLDAMEPLSSAAWAVTQKNFVGPTQLVAMSRVAPEASASDTCGTWTRDVLAVYGASRARIVPQVVQNAFSPAVDRPLKQNRSESVRRVLLWNACPDSAGALKEWPKAVADGVDEFCDNAQRLGEPEFSGLAIEPSTLTSVQALEAASGLGLLCLPPRVGISMSFAASSPDDLGRRLSGRRFGGNRVVAVAVDDVPNDVEQLSAIVPRVLLIRNFVRSHLELRDERFAESVVSDIVAECKRFAGVRSFKTWAASSDTPGVCFDEDSTEYNDTCRLFVEFGSFVDAEVALSGLHSVKFGPLVLHVTFFDNARFSADRLAPDGAGEEDIDAVELL